MASTTRRRDRIQIRKLQQALSARYRKTRISLHRNSSGEREKERERRPTCLTSLSNGGGKPRRSSKKQRNVIVPRIAAKIPVARPAGNVPMVRAVCRLERREKKTGDVDGCGFGHEKGLGKELESLDRANLPINPTR